jgi:hypothetical protein
MKREGNLYQEILSWRNLLLASKKARRGKRYRFDVSEFHWDMERELISIQQALREKTYNPGCYRSFEITDPKRRMISAAPYRDRVVHHAICNIIEPTLDRRDAQPMSVRQLIQSLIDDLTVCLQRTTNPSSDVKNPYFVLRAGCPQYKEAKPLVVWASLPAVPVGLSKNSAGRMPILQKEKNHR